MNRQKLVNVCERPLFTNLVTYVARSARIPHVHTSVVPVLSTGTKIIPVSALFIPVPVLELELELEQ